MGRIGLGGLISAIVLFSATMINDSIAQPDSRGLKRIMESQAGKRWAICIGINNYADRNLNKLNKAANDAYGLAGVLEQQGDFEVSVFSDIDAKGNEQSFSSTFFPTKDRIEQYLTSIVQFKDIQSNDLIVFSFSGHGISDNQGNGYLIPIDWKSTEPYNSAIPVSTVIAWLQKLGVTRSLVLIDACRENMSTSRSVASMNRLFEEKFESANVSAVFYATKQGGFSYEDPKSDYGAFTRFLIDGLQGGGDDNKDGLVTFRELSGFVEDGLGRWARNNGYMQRPYTRIMGEQSGDLALTLAQWDKVKRQYRRPVQTPQKPAGSTRVVEGITMVSIPGGSFRMGYIQGGGIENELPVHTVTISPFEMSATEITQAQYKAVMGMNPSRFKGDNLPVENVSWNDAIEFCKRLSQKTGSEFSLPTEAEWEYACRAGTETKYYTGNSESDLARAGWYSRNSGRKTHSVGQKEPNAYGLYDMHGNVWEWCYDWYGSYNSGSVTNPIGPSSGSSRVDRGGSWFNDVGICRSAIRYWLRPSNTSSIIGFRVVRRP